MQSTIAQVHVIAAVAALLVGGIVFPMRNSGVTLPGVLSPGSPPMITVILSRESVDAAPLLSEDAG